MRVVVIGQAAFGEAVYKALVARGEQVAGVCAPGTAAGTRPDALRAVAEADGLTVLETRRLRRPEVFEQYAGWQPELVVMAFVTDILRENVLVAPTRGVIQYHPSLLPRHRGNSAINWAIISGEERTGLTIFWPDEGIDTGPILLQKDVAIEVDDTTGSLYFNKLFPLGVQAMVEAVEMVRLGTAPRSAQDEWRATYEKPCREEDAEIDWAAPAGQTYNLIRGCNPQPGAWTTVRGEQLKLFDVERADGNGAGEPGEVLAIEPEGVLIALPRAVLRLKRVQRPGQGKIPASQYAGEAGLRAGERLGTA